MTPLPKRKISRARGRRRRSHQALSRTRLVECTSCHNMRLPHTVCPSCGTYRGESVVSVEGAS